MSKKHLSIILLSGLFMGMSVTPSFASLPAPCPGGSDPACNFSHTDAACKELFPKGFEAQCTSPDKTQCNCASK